MSEQVFQTRYETYRTAVESYLETLFAGRPDWRDLYESMRYSLLAGGKRIRPVLTLEFARLAGLADWKTALPMACALELVHTYPELALALLMLGVLADDHHAAFAADEMFINKKGIM